MPTRLQNLSEKTLQIQYDDRSDIEVRVSSLAEIISERTREIVDAILWHIQKSGFAGNLRSGIVITGGGANLLGLSYLIKERSGYNVKMGYPRHLFSAEGCSGIYETSATAAMGMILAAKNDRLPDCVDLPEFDPEALRNAGLEVVEPTEDEAPETVEETSGTEWNSDFENGEQGTLIDESEFGEPVKKEKPKEKKPRRRWKAPSIKTPESINVLWQKVRNTFEEIYDDATK